MNVSAVRQSSFEACKATLTGSRPVVTLRIDRLSEVPLPGRAPVTLTLGKDPMGLVPGLTRAVALRQAILKTRLECPTFVRSFALERVRCSRSRVEVSLMLFPSSHPRNEAAAVARVRLRFATETGVFSGRVESLVTLEPDEEAMAACDFTIDSLLEELAGVEEA